MRSHRAGKGIPTPAGMIENARARLDSSVTSEMADLMTPAFPFSAPRSVRLTIMVKRLLEKPKHKMDKALPRAPMQRTSRLPTRSDS
jgi:hypothetical protein